MIEVRMEVEDDSGDFIVFQEVPIPGEMVKVGTLHVRKDEFPVIPVFVTVTVQPL